MLHVPIDQIRLMLVLFATIPFGFVFKQIKSTILLNRPAAEQDARDLFRLVFPIFSVLRTHRESNCLNLSCLHPHSADWQEMRIDYFRLVASLSISSSHLPLDL